MSARCFRWKGIEFAASAEPYKCAQDVRSFSCQFASVYRVRRRGQRRPWIVSGALGREQEAKVEAAVSSSTWACLYPPKGVVHCDLKLNNILVGGDGQAKLSDFGLSSMRACVSLSKTAPSGSMSRDLRWSAPECLKQRPHVASDVYSLAMCMIEAATGEPPFSFLGHDDVRDNVRKGEIPAQSDGLSDDEWELVISMTSFDPSRRVPLQHVVDKLKVLAHKESAGGSEATETDCAVCFCTISDGFRFCSQCGAQVEANVPIFERKFQPRSPVSRDAAPVLAASTSVFDLVRITRDGERDDQEESLLLLFQACLNDERRNLIYEANGLPLLIETVKHGRTHFIQALAMGCLAWATELDSKLPEREFKAIRPLSRCPHLPRTPRS